MTEVSVVIVNYRNQGYLQRCLAALEQQTFRDFDAVVVDNDGSAGAVPERVRVVATGANLGFAAGTNRGVQATQGRWVATLNPDAFAEPEWLERLVAASRRHPQAVMFGSAQIDAADATRLDGAGDVFHAAGIVWRGHHGAPIEALPPEGTVFAPCAAAALYRRDAFESAGGFDEGFFCYCEDIDLAFRLRLGGATCVQVPDARVRHVGSGIVGERSAFAVYHGTRNLLWTYVKNMPGPLLWLTLPAHVVMQLARLAACAAQGRLRPGLSGLFDGVRGLPPILAARQRVQAGRRVGWRTIARALTWSPAALLRRAGDVRPL